MMSSSDEEAPQKKVKFFYKHKYNESWEKEFHWLTKSEKGSTYFFCMICQKNLIGGIAAVKKHATREKHLKMENLIKTETPKNEMLLLPSTSGTDDQDKTKELEIRIATFIAEHNISINTVDHLDALIKEISKYSIAAKDIQMKRTKCTGIIKNVTGNYVFNNLIEKLKTTNFSILIDESTDHGSIKNLAIVARFTDEDLNTTDQFLTLLPIAEATATEIHKKIVKLFELHNVNYKKLLIGLAADGANVMMGTKNSVQKLLSDEIEHLVVVKCICHSLALCASHACLKLSKTPEDLVRDIYSYMKYSYKRIEQFKKFQEFVHTKPHKILQNCQTRWLSLLSVVKRVVEQYDALKLFFQAEHLIDNFEAATIIHNRLCDPLNLCYLEFMEFILPYIIDLNIEYQSESPKLHLLYGRMRTLVKTILEFYIKPSFLKDTDFVKTDYENPEMHVELENIYVGPKLMAKFEKKILNNSQKTELLEKCLAFYIELTTQILKRFNFDSDFVQTLKLINFLNPQNICNIASLGPLINSKFLNKVIEDINELDKEWRMLKNSEIYENLNNSNYSIFWKNVAKLKKGDDSMAFPKLIQLISLLFTLPHSSAAVERIFSQINLNKTKTRNRLSLKRFLAYYIQNN